MNINTAFPSKYLKAADIKGKEVPVKLSHVDMEEMGDDTRPVLYFIGKDKGLVLNRTNGEILSDAYGDETDNWKGKSAVLATHKVLFKGQPTDGITIRVPNGRDLDDEVPF